MPTSTKPGPDATPTNRLLRWCVGIFSVSILILGGILFYAWREGNLMIYLTSAGMVYLICSFAFLIIIMIAFIGGHLGSSSEIEAPKLALFDIERQK